MKKDSKCCVCNRELKKNDYATVNSDSSVCSSCMEKIAGIHSSLLEMGIVFDSSQDNPKAGYDFEFSKSLRPKEVKAMLDKYVVGQEVAKKILSVATYNHFKRRTMEDTGIKKSNILLIGPTGSGKTYLVQTLAKILNVPLAITPATSLTEAGYIGDDVESCVQRLLEKANGDVNLAEHGIIFIDEIDKLTATSSETKRQVGGKGVQQALLPLLEGTKVTIPAKDSFGRPGGEKIEVDTTNILFICGGAFPDAEDIIRTRIKGKKTIGFSSGFDKEPILDEKNLLLSVNNDDLREFGLIPELLGRLPVVAPLESLTVDILKKILSEPVDSIVSQYQKLFSFDSINLIFKEDALKEIASKALSKGTGARSLRGILEELLLDLMYETPTDMNTGEIIITRDFVNGEAMPLIIEKEKEPISANL